MKTNMDQILKTLDGDSLKDNGKLLKLKDICINALMSMDENTTPEEKINQYELALKVNKGGEVELSSENRVLLKKLVGKLYGPLVYGQANGMLENDD